MVRAYNYRNFGWLSGEDSLPAREVVAAGTFLALLQAADGILTSLGVTRFGISAEGNPLLRELMSEFGQLPTLALFKVAAILIICSLISLSRHLPWIKHALSAVCGIYLFAAVLPWTYILFIQPHLNVIY